LFVFVNKIEKHAITSYLPPTPTKGREIAKIQKKKSEKTSKNHGKISTQIKHMFSSGN
jgi:hypothetical protein